ncbi:hypothetical protein BE21_26445 [Sorangium cellulosum]|uniref:Uncharacterized protein n=1 Tax=Sorangium cellulosum TaxID=56 RepID=A0A150TTC7_SORCE|nr:hypothetical protein BE21_26445 [Sorangium cellulosum]
MLCRLLRFQRNLADLHHDVFVRTLGSLSKLEHPSAPEGWLTMIAGHEARSSIACMKQCSWLWFLPSDERPEVESGVASGEVLDALLATYAAWTRSWCAAALLLAGTALVLVARRRADGFELGMAEPGVSGRGSRRPCGGASEPVLRRAELRSRFSDG